MSVNRHTSTDRSFICLLLLIIAVSQCSIEVSERKQTIAIERYVNAQIGEAP